jgi:hypothetical protein
MSIVYAIVQVPSPIAWGAVTGILAMLPFIGYAAVAAVCVAQLTHDATASALLVGAVGFSVLFFSDKFVRPMLMVKGARLDFLSALMGTVGGLQTFGLLGLFIGPMMVAVGKTMLDEWLTNSRQVPCGREIRSEILLRLSVSPAIAWTPSSSNEIRVIAIITPPSRTLNAGHSRGAHRSEAGFPDLRAHILHSKVNCVPIV